MDFANLDLATAAANGAEMHVRHPVTDEPLTHEGSPVTIRLRGHDSPEFRAVSMDIARRSARKSGSVPAQESEKRIADLMFKLTISWTNVWLNGEPLEFGRENAINLYTTHTWLREQIDTFVTDRGNFFKTAND